MHIFFSRESTNTFQDVLNSIRKLSIARFRQRIVNMMSTRCFDCLVRDFLAISICHHRDIVADIFRHLSKKRKKTIYVFVLRPINCPTKKKV